MNEFYLSFMMRSKPYSKPMKRIFVVILIILVFHPFTKSQTSSAKEEFMNSRPDLVQKTTTSISSFTDSRDGETYKKIKIGNQTWMAENLKASKFNDGTPIPQLKEGILWSNSGKLKKPGYCWYDNNKDNYKNKYGAIYNWYTVETNKLCPKGWHVPTSEEWGILENYLINNGYNYDGSLDKNKIAKSLADTIYWSSSTEPGSIGNTDYQTIRNKTGFSAIPSGFRMFYGGFEPSLLAASWWLSDKYDEGTANAYSTSSGSRGFRISDFPKSCGLSVRCLLGNDSQPSNNVTKKEQVNSTGKPFNKTSYISSLKNGRLIYQEGTFLFAGDLRTEGKNITFCNIGIRINNDLYSTSFDYCVNLESFQELEGNIELGFSGSISKRQEHNSISNRKIVRGETTYESMTLRVVILTTQSGKPLSFNFCIIDSGGNPNCYRGSLSYRE